jgi:hypothetical protein
VQLAVAGTQPLGEVGLYEGAGGEGHPDLDRLPVLVVHRQQRGGDGVRHRPRRGVAGFDDALPDALAAQLV